VPLGQEVIYEFRTDFTTLEGIVANKSMITMKTDTKFNYEALTRKAAVSSEFTEYLCKICKTVIQFQLAEHQDHLGWITIFLAVGDQG